MDRKGLFDRVGTHPNLLVEAHHTASQSHSAASAVFEDAQRFLDDFQTTIS